MPKEAPSWSCRLRSPAAPVSFRRSTAAIPAVINGMNSIESPRPLIINGMIVCSWPVSSVHRDIRNTAVETQVSPAVAMIRGPTRFSSSPEIGLMIIVTSPRGMNARPVCVGV